MKVENVSFPEAVERLAHDAGMAVPQDTPEERERSKQQQTLFDVMEKTAVYYERNLRLPEGRVALDYLRERGLDDASIKKFRIGFSLDSRGALKTALAREGIDEAQMVAAGLTIKSDDTSRQPYDRFRKRVMFPILDARGRVIAFGGRILGEGEPKYLNSPDTPLFHKGRILYGLSHAAPAARQSETLIVTEGYMDVIALSRAGITAAVAPLGTALTEDQLGLLWKMTREPVLCFDGDNAGARAAARAAERALPLLKPGLGLRFVALPAGEDPDTLIKSQGVEVFNRHLAAAEPLSDMLWWMVTRGKPAKTPEEKSLFQKKLEDYGRQIEDTMVRGHFLKAFKDRIWARAGSRQYAAGSSSSSQWAAARSSGSAQEVLQRREAILLVVLLTHPSLYDHIGERLGKTGFSAVELDKLRQETLNTLAHLPSLDSAGLEHQLRESGFTGILSSLLSPKVYDHAFFARPETDNEMARKGWEETFSLYHQRDLKAEIKEAKAGLAGEMTAEAMERFRALKAQEHQTQDF
jgi:DNA primase